MDASPARGSHCVTTLPRAPSLLFSTDRQSGMGTMASASPERMLHGRIKAVMLVVVRGRRHPLEVSSLITQLLMC